MNLIFRKKKKVRYCQVERKLFSVAEEYVSLIDTKIILIDGKQLAKLIVECNVGVGVSTVGVYEVKRIDFDNEY